MQLNFFKKFVVCLFLLLTLNTIFIPFVNANENSTINIESPVALLMDSSTGKILYEKNINEKRYPASLTKVMTAIIVLEKCNLSDIATVSYDAIMSIPYGYVTANLKEGEELTIEQLLYLLMVGSCNDAAVVLAEHVSGSIQDFSILMNQKATEIGCTSSNFVNPNGLHDENHYSTAYDLALISKYAMQNETFRTIVSTTYYKLPATNKYDKEDRIFVTTNTLLRGDYYYKYATGIKTGFTTPAQNCLVASASKNNLELITVILGATQTENGSSQRYLDTISLLEYGFENYKLKEFLKSGEAVQTINIKYATKNTKKLDLVVADDINILISQEGENSAIIPKITLINNLKAPIKKGDTIGSVTYIVEGIEYTENLLAKNDVKRSYVFITFIILIFILIIFYFSLNSLKRKKKNRRLKIRLK